MGSMRQRVNHRSANRTLGSELLLHKGIRAHKMSPDKQFFSLRTTNDQRTAADYSAGRLPKSCAYSWYQEAELRERIPLLEHGLMPPRCPDQREPFT